MKQRKPKKNTLIRIRMTADEKKRLQDAAQQVHLPLARYTRNVLCSKEIVQLPFHSEVLVMLYDLMRNLETINIPPDERTQVTDKLSRIMSVMMAIEGEEYDHRQI